jgi:hypothetical protein
MHVEIPKKIVRRGALSSSIIIKHNLESTSADTCPTKTKALNLHRE